VERGNTSDPSRSPKATRPNKAEYPRRVAKPLRNKAFVAIFSRLPKKVRILLALDETKTKNSHDPKNLAGDSIA
jgi:hypothetical protein